MPFRSFRTFRPKSRYGDDDDIRDRIDSRGGSRGRSSSSEGRYSGSSSGGTSSRSSRKPLGVPSDYTTLRQRSQASFRGMSANAVEGWSAQGAGPGSFAERKPMYHEGDQYRPAASGFDAIIARQRALLIGGYIGAGDDFVFGRWDKTTQDAYERLLSEANMAGLTAEVMLEQAAQGIHMGGEGLGGGGGGGGLGGGGGVSGGEGGMQIDPETGELIEITETFVPPPLELQTTNQADLARVFRSAVRDRLGEGWTDAQIHELVQAYNWQEIRVQKDAYDQEVARLQQEFDAGVSGTTALSTDGSKPNIPQQEIHQLSTPTPETFVEDKLRKTPQAQEHEGMNMLMDLVGRWGGGGMFG